MAGIIKYQTSQNAYNIGSGGVNFLSTANAIDKLINNYKKRVLADGGTYENNACLVAELNILSTAYNYGDIVNAWVAKATELSYTIPSPGTLSVLQTQLSNIGDTTLAKMDVLHIYSPDAGTMDFFTLNVIAPNTFQSTLVNAPTTSIDGVLTNGSGYVDTGANPSNFSNYSLNDAQMSVYFSQNIHDNGGVNYPAGLISLNSSSLIMAPAPGVSSGRDYSAVNSVFFRNDGATNMSVGFKTIQRVNSSQLKTYNDGIQIANLTRSSTVLANGNIFLGGVSREGVFDQGNTNKFLADIFGSSLTTTEMSTIGAAIEAIQAR